MNNGHQHISNDELRSGDIPPSDAEWEAIGEFALTFDGYKEHGSFEKCAEIAEQCRHTTLADLRTCLFFEQRRWRHQGDEPHEGAMVYIKDIVEKIRTMVKDSTK